MTGERGAWLAVDEEADLGDIGKVGTDRRTDGEHGERLGFEPRGMAGRECACEIDDGELIAGRLGSFRSGNGQEKDLGDRG